MKPFVEMWETAKSLGTNLEELAEDLYNKWIDRATPKEGNSEMVRAFRSQTAEDLEMLLNIIAEVHNYLKYLTEEKVERTDINKLRLYLENHKHAADGQVLLPMEE